VLSIKLKTEDKTNDFRQFQLKAVTIQVQTEDKTNDFRQFQLKAVTIQVQTEPLLCLYEIFALTTGKTRDDGKNVLSAA
jgi:hypothetical protein